MSDPNKIIPKTVKEAVALLVIGNSVGDSRKFVLEKSHEELPHAVGMGLRNGWNIWEPDSPLKRDAVKLYKIAHADDISGLIIAWTWAEIRGEAFDPVQHCEFYHKHWKEHGATSLAAGGWKEDGSGPTEESLQHWRELTKKRPEKEPLTKRSAEEAPKPGYYRHFKGDIYVVLDTVFLTESKETMVLYKDFSSGKHFARPIPQFNDRLHSCGEKPESKLRFTPLTTDEILALHQK